MEWAGAPVKGVVDGLAVDGSSERRGGMAARLFALDFEHGGGKNDAPASLEFPHWDTEVITDHRRSCDSLPNVRRYLQSRRSIDQSCIHLSNQHLQQRSGLIVHNDCHLFSYHRPSYHHSFVATGVQIQ